jgi:hypothetical protein
MKKLYTTLALILFGFTLFAQKLPFQGYLEESGIPVNGTRTFDFELTDYGWSETVADVPIDNGIYNVVLGEITPLPDTIFSNLSETGLSITVDGTNIGVAMLYKPLVNGNSLLSNGQSLQVRNAEGKLKADLGSGSAGEDGRLQLYDSASNLDAQIVASKFGPGNFFSYNENGSNAAGWFGGIGNDGFTQLVSFDETDAISGAIILGSFVDGIHPEVYIEGIAQPNFGLGRFRVIELPGGEETMQLEINRSNGGGQAKLQIMQDDAGADPTGVAGTLELFADSSPNFILGSTADQDHDLANMDIYGSIEDGGSWYYNAANFGVRKTSDGLNEFGELSLFNNQSGTQANTLTFMGNLNETGAGGVEVRNSIGTTTISLNGERGDVLIYDSLGASNGFLRARNQGGLLQLNKIDGAGNFASAIVASSSTNTSRLSLFGQNPVANNASLMIEHYITGNEIDQGPAMSGNYKRSGSDWKDNTGKLLAAIGTARQESGGDPTGSSGYVSLWGTNSFNAQLTGKRWDNNDLPIFELFGSNTDAGSFFQSNFDVEIMRGAGTTSYADLRMSSTDDGGLGYEGILVTSDYAAAGLGGGIEVRDNSGANTVFLEGGTGNIIVTGTVSAGGSVLTSDRRLKKDIQPLSAALENTLKMRGTSYY